MGAEFIAHHSVDLGKDGPGTVPEWVHLLPIGTFGGRDGRGPYTVDAAKVIGASMAYQRGADIPIDYDHQLVHAMKNGQPAVAAGWIKELRVFPNGIWGRVEWTEAAAARIRSREYRYLSPMFTHDEAGNVIRLAGAGLVNMPNLELTSLNSQQGTSMDPTILAQLRALLGLPEGADDAAILKAAKDLTELAAIIRRASKLPEDTPFAGVLDALKQRAGGAMPTTAPAATHAATPTEAPPGFVPVAALEHMAAQANTFRQQVLGQAVEHMVGAAISGGKLPPALSEWATAYASADPEGFKTFAATMPQILAPGALTPAAPPSDRDPASGLSAGQLAVCSSLGLDPKEFRQSI